MTPQSRWNKKHPNKMRAATIKWREKNRDKARATCRQWKKNNAAKHAAMQMKRKAAQLQRTPSWADFDSIQKYYDEAQRLTEATGVQHHVDHVIPLQGILVSGLHVHHNLQVLTAAENTSKGNKMYQFVGSVLENDEEILPWLS